MKLNVFETILDANVQSSHFLYLRAAYVSDGDAPSQEAWSTSSAPGARAEGTVNKT